MDLSLEQKLKSTKIVCLRNVDIYEGIPEKELINITQEAIEGRMTHGTVFYGPDKPPTDVYILKEGEVEIVRDENGKKVIIETLLPGDIFGDFGTGNVNHYAVASRRCYVCKTPTNEFLDVVRQHPEMALKLMRTMAERTEYYENKLATQARPAKDQLLEEIKNLEEKNKRRVLGKFFDIPLRISHQRLAEKTGLNRVTVTKLMGELRREKKIFVNTATGAISTKDETKAAA